MPDVIAFWTACLKIVAEFLLTEPISYFTAVFLLCAVVTLVRHIIA